MTSTTDYSRFEAPSALNSHQYHRPLTRSRHDDVASLPAAVMSEWIKLRSLRSNRAVLGLAVVIGVLLSWVLATFVKTDPKTHVIFTVGQTFIFSTWLSTVLTVIIGALLFTSEVQHGTLATTVTAQTARWVIVAAKSMIAASFGFAMGIVGIIGGFVGAVGGGLKMGDTSGMAAATVWGLFLTSLAGVFGLGVGMIIRHSSAAVSTLLVWAFVIENLIRSVAPATMSRFLPFSAADGLLAIQSAGDTPRTMAVALTRVHDAFLFGGYTVAILAIGTALLYRRDAN